MRTKLLRGFSYWNEEGESRERATLCAESIDQQYVIRSHCLKKSSRLNNTLKQLAGITSKVGTGRYDATIRSRQHDYRLVSDRPKHFERT